MNPKELRIGNLIKYKGETMTVDFVSNDTVGASSSSRSVSTNPDDYEPIPLPFEVLPIKFVHQLQNLFHALIDKEPK